MYDKNEPPLVQKLNCISSEIELPLVQKLNSNKNQSTRTKEQQQQQPKLNDQEQPVVAAADFDLSIWNELKAHGITRNRKTIEIVRK